MPEMHHEEAGNRGELDLKAENNASGERFGSEETRDWRIYQISSSRRYHTCMGIPAYSRKFEEVMTFHEPGLAPARSQSKWFHINPDGSRAYAMEFDRVWGFYNDLAAVVSDGQAFHIGSDGEPAYSERYSWTGNFQEGMCTVRDALGRYFHIMGDGQRPYAETYIYAGDYKEGLAAVYSMNSGSFHIDTRGKRIYSSEFMEVGAFHKGIAPARDSSGWFHIDRNGKEIYRDRYAGVEPFYNGRAKVSGHHGNVMTISESGKILDTLVGAQ